MNIPAPYDHSSGSRTLAQAMRELHEFRLAWFEHFGQPDLTIIRRMTYGTPVVEQETVEEVEQPIKRKKRRQVESEE